MYNFFQIVSYGTRLNRRDKIISFGCSSKHNVFCYSNGEAHIYSDDWESTIFHIKDDVKMCCVPEECNIFITLCKNLGTSKSALKLFNFSKYPRKAPSLVGKTKFEFMCEVSTVNAFKCLDNELCIAIGLHNGNILLHKSSSKEISQKAFKCFNVCSKPIKGIEFSQYNEEVILFTCADDGVFFFKLLSNTFLNETKVLLDDIVSAVHCCTLQPKRKLNNERYFVVARDDGLYCYTKEGRGPCYALNGKKKVLKWFREKYIIVLNVNSWKMQCNESFQLMIVDIDSKIIVFSKEIYNVVGIQTTNGLPNCLIFMKNGDVMTLKEKGLLYKIKHLIKENMYDMALKILEEYNIDHEILADVLISYGDHMLQRGDILGAVNIYSKTIGIVSPFTIVNKLSDFRYNDCLIDYLSLLTSTEYKSSEHIRLLKNCLQRIELHNAALIIFNQGSHSEQFLGSCPDIERREKMSSILEAIQHKRNILANLNMFSNEEVIDFLFEYGYFLIMQHPNDFKETAKYLLTEISNKQYKTQRAILPLLLLNKIFATSLIDDVFNPKAKFLYNIWTELILQMWQKGNVNIKFVINFFEINEEHICIDNAFIICRVHEFWPGIRLMYEKCGVQILSMRSLSKCFEMYPVYINEFSNECYHYNQMWLRSLLKDGHLLNNSYNIVSEIFKRIIKTNPYYILNIVAGFMTISNIFVSHLSDLFLSKIFEYFKPNELSKKVSILEKKVYNARNILQNYNNQPIEFRSRSCAVCKQMIKLPTLYFLCQHSFHKECIRPLSDSLECLICSNNRESGITLITHTQVQNSQYKSNKLQLNQNFWEKMEKSILCINSSLHIRSLYENISNLELDNSKNVAKKYDDNLNPFNVNK